MKKFGPYKSLGSGPARSVHTLSNGGKTSKMAGLGGIGNIMEIIGMLSKLDLSGLGNLFGSKQPTQSANSQDPPEANTTQNNPPQPQPSANVAQDFSPQAKPQPNNTYLNQQTETLLNMQQRLCKEKSREVLLRQMESHQARVHTLSDKHQTTQQ